MRGGVFRLGGEPIHIYYYDYLSSPDRRVAGQQQKAYSDRLLRQAVLLETGRELESFPLSLGAHGKPLYRGLSCNVSHTRGMVACVIGSGEVGVDCERIRPYKMEVARRVCSDGEFSRLEKGAPLSEFFRMWTFKEAFVKMLGCGLRYPLSRATLEGENTVRCAFPNMKVFEALIGNYALCAVENPGQAASKLLRMDLSE